MTEARRFAERFYQEVSRGNLDFVDEALAEDFVEHEDIPGVAPGRDGVKELFATLKQAFPDLLLRAEDTVAEGDRVVIRFRLTGTHEGEFLGIAPTGREVDVTGFDMVRVEGGKAVEHWGATDMLKLMEQLGALPFPEAVQH